MSDSTQKPSQPQTQPKATLGEFVIEIVAKNNQTVQFPPLRTFLRGKWDNHKMPLGVRSERGLAQMPIIPGVHVRIDPNAQIGEVIDPLADDKELMDSISRVYKGLDRQGRTPRPNVRRSLNKDETVTWIVWMLRLLHTNKAKLVRGTQPRIDDIKRAFPNTTVQMVWSVSMAERPEVSHRSVDQLEEMVAA